MLSVLDRFVISSSRSVYRDLEMCESDLQSSVRKTDVFSVEGIGKNTGQELAPVFRILEHFKDIAEGFIENKAFPHSVTIPSRNCFPSR